VSLCGRGRAVFPARRHLDNEEFLYGRKPLSTETDASVSGGGDATRYYVSALVKNDEGYRDQYRLRETGGPRQPGPDPEQPGQLRGQHQRDSQPLQPGSLQ
jgi:hypothetical protein